jgi:hypothetical protein
LLLLRRGRRPLLRPLLVSLALVLTWAAAASGALPVAARALQPQVHAPSHMLRRPGPVTLALALANAAPLAGSARSPQIRWRGTGSDIVGDSCGGAAAGWACSAAADPLVKPSCETASGGDGGTAAETVGDLGMGAAIGWPWPSATASSSSGSGTGTKASSDFGKGAAIVWASAAESLAGGAGTGVAAGCDDGTPPASKSGRLVDPLVG